MKIGHHSLQNNLVLAPMAGVTDRPFRQLCRELGAGGINTCHLENPHRLGSPQHGNAIEIAKIAAQAGIQALTIHGRMRACGFSGKAEYDTIAEIKSLVSIPVIANGDITSAQVAAQILRYTRADGLMIGRAAQGKPWIFRQIEHYLRTNEVLAAPNIREVARVLLTRLDRLYRFYGEYMGVRIARKHISWYCREHTGSQALRAFINQAACSREQVNQVREYFTLYQDRDLAA